MFIVTDEKGDGRSTWTIFVTEQETEEHQSKPRVLGFHTKKTVILESRGLCGNGPQKKNGYIEDIQFQEAIAHFEEKGWRIETYNTKPDGGRVVVMTQQGSFTHVP